MLNHTGSQVWKYTGSGSFDHVHMSSNGEYIIAGQSDGDLLLFDSGNSTPYGEYDIGTFISGGGEYIPTQLAISENGKWFTGVSTNKYLRFFP